MRTSRTVLAGLAALVALGAVGVATYWLGMNRGMSMAARETQANPAASGALNNEQGEEATRRHIRSGLKAGDVDPATGQKILYYRDPMVPGNKFDKPAKSPFMDMMLVPVYAGAESGD